MVAKNSQPCAPYNLIGAIKDFNIPADLAKTMLEGVKLADYADNKAFFGAAGADSDYANIFRMAEDMYRELAPHQALPDAEAASTGVHRGA